MEVDPGAAFSLEQPLVDVEQGRVSKLCGDGSVTGDEVCNFLLCELLFEVQKYGSAYGNSKGSRSWMLVALLSCLLTRFCPKPGETIDREPQKYKNRATCARCEQQLNGVIACYTFDFKLEKNLPTAVIMVVQGDRHETKWPDSLYQALHHGGMAAAIKNSSVNRLRVVHCLVVGNGWWSCAEIHPFGNVMVKPGNRIISSSVAEFRAQLQTKGMQNLTDSGKLISEICQRSSGNKSLLVELEGRIRSRTEEAARMLNSKLVFDMVVHGDKIERSFSSVIDKRKMLLVGKVVYDGEVHSSSILSFPMTHKVTADDKVLVWGLLRILFGNRVKYWTVPALEKLLATRDKELEEKVRTVVLDSRVT